MLKKLMEVIDDDSDILSILRGVLEAEGYQTVTSVVADSLPPASTATRFDFARRDALGKREWSGRLPATEATREHPAYPCGADVSSCLRPKTMVAGLANTWLSKPFDLDTLSHLIEAQLPKQAEKKSSWLLIPFSL